jgi:hypothetical protein
VTDLFPRGDAVISPCGRYRYRLERRFDHGPKVTTFIMLNPSTADAEHDDQTIRRCLGFARAWRCSKLVVVNLFAWRATAPAELKGVEDPVGPELERGVDFAGHVIKPHRRTIRRRTFNEALARLERVPADELWQSANSYFGLLRQASRSHRDRARLANLVRRRGLAVDHGLSKAYG